MHAKTALFLALLLGLTALAGCIGSQSSDPGEADPTQPTGEDDQGTAAPEENPDQPTDPSLPTHVPLVRLDNPVDSWEADVGCTLGGGPVLPRTGDGYVADGTTHLSILLTNPQTSAGYLQVGYIVDGGGAHETDVDGEISWLEPVPPGETVNRTVEVPPDLAETGPGDTRWDFYSRYTTPEAQETTCYTGASLGPDQVHIDAVRGDGTTDG